MDGRKRTCNTCIVPGDVWPQVHNLTTMDTLLLASRMVFSQPTHSNISLDPSFQKCVEPVDVAISWLQREVESHNRDMELLEHFRIPPPVPEDDRLPPTLPYRMKGRVGVREYELQDKEQQCVLRERIKEWREKKLLKKYHVESNEVKENTKMERIGDASGDTQRGVKRKSDEGSPCITDTERHRPKRFRIPNSKYDSATFVLAQHPPSRCSQVSLGSPGRRNQ